MKPKKKPFKLIAVTSTRSSSFMVKANTMGLTVDQDISQAVRARVRHSVSVARGDARRRENGDEDDGRPHGPPVLRIADASGQGVSGPALLPVAYGSEKASA